LYKITNKHINLLNKTNKGNKTMTNTKTILKLSFSKSSDFIRAAITPKGNVTLVGEVVYSTDLTVSYYNSLCELTAPNCIGKVATLVLNNDQVTETLIENINALFIKRPKNTAGNRFPFIWLVINTEAESIIFNKSIDGSPDRLSILGLNAAEIIIRKDAPLEVLNEINRVVTPAVNRDYYSSRKHEVISTSLTVLAAQNGVVKTKTKV
jgi:hypothetical protein